MQNLRKHLPLLIDLTKRDFRLRYLGSVLGSYWNLVHPLVMIFIYTVIFSRVMHSRLGQYSEPYAYSIYLCSGLLAWNFFAEVLNRCNTTLLENAAFLKKLSFPPFVLFGAAYASAALNFAIATGVFWAALLVLGKITAVKAFASLIVAAAFGMMALGVGAALGCLNVFVRDVQQLIAIVLQLWFWFTPLVYVEDALPEKARMLLWLNPAFPFVSSLHDLMFYNRWPSVTAAAVGALWVSLSMSIGLILYRRSISLVRDQL